MSRISDKRKQEILEAAAQCFALQGFHQTSIDDICRAVKLSPGSVYRYFRSKTDIIQALVKAEQEESIRLIESVSTHADPVAGLKQVIKDALETFNNPRSQALHAEMTAEAFRNKAVAAIVEKSYTATVTALTKAIREAQCEKTIDPGLNPAITAELIVALFDGLQFRQAILPQAAPTRHAKSLSLLIERLLQPTKKPALLRKRA